MRCCPLSRAWRGRSQLFWEIPSFKTPFGSLVFKKGQGGVTGTCLSRRLKAGVWSGVSPASSRREDGCQVTLQLSPYQPHCKHVGRRGDGGGAGAQEGADPACAASCVLVVTLNDCGQAKGTVTR